MNGRSRFRECKQNVREVRAVELELEISGASKPENTATHQPLSAVSDMSEL
jgi:hypothetical protein